MSGGHHEQRTVQQQGKWLPFSNKIPLNIKITVTLLMISIWLMVFMAVSSKKPSNGHGHH